MPITLDHTIRRKLAASSGATFRVTSSATVIDLSKRYRRLGKAVGAVAVPIGSRDGKNRSCLLLEINATERGKCRRSRQCGRIAPKFGDFPRYTNSPAHNIRALARNFCSEVFQWNTLRATRLGALPAAGLAVRRLLLQNRLQQFGRLMRA
ncbi:hypothetical protein [Bradyrhizobium liaoningense]|nr:hypothetical protein QIH91_16845 [Bradyrhizobium japonicum USDA 135]